MFSARDTTNRDLSWIDPDKYVLVTGPAELSRLAQHLGDVKGPKSTDCETNGLSPIVHKVVGLSFSPEPGHAYYIPVRHKSITNIPVAQVPDIIRLLQSHKWTTFNGGFDWKMIKASFGVEIDIEDDVQADMWLTDSDRGPREQRKKLRLDHLSKEFCGLDQLHLEDLLPPDVFDFSLVEDEIDALFYAGGDADSTLRVKLEVDKRIEKFKLGDLSKLEARVAVVAARMEYHGIQVDAPYAATLDVSPELQRLQDIICQKGGHFINPGSPDQLAELLYDILKLRPPKEGSRSVDEKALTKLKNAHPVVQPVLDWRELHTLQKFFLEKLNDVAAEDGRLHSEYCGTGTRSGRFSAQGGVGRGGVRLKVNGQQLPKATKGSAINCRKVLRASKRRVWYSSDFKQIEYVTLAYISQDKGLMEGIKNGVDFHRNTYSLMYKVPVMSVDDAMRSKGKTLNFGIVYGMSDVGLALQLGTPTRDAAALRRAYFTAIPGVDKLITDTKAYIQRYGHVRTEFGRIRHYDCTGCTPPQIESLLMSGFNTRIQGTAADLNKFALVKLDAMLRKHYGNRVALLSTIHDEVNLEADDDIPIGELCAFIAEHMTIKPGIKAGWLGFGVDLEVGENYGEILSVPSHLWPTVKTLQDVVDFHGHQPAKKKVEAPLVEAQLKKVTISPPAVIIDVGDNPTEAKLEMLKEKVDTAYGMYQMYVKQGELFYLCHGTKVNPSPSFIDAVSKTGFKVQVFKPSTTKTFDPSKLTLV